MASRGVAGVSEFSTFNVYMVYGGETFSCVNFSLFLDYASFDSGGMDSGCTWGLRPVVSLESNIQLEKDETATTAEKTYWKIK